LIMSLPLDWMVSVQAATTLLPISVDHSTEPFLEGQEEGGEGGRGGWRRWRRWQWWAGRLGPPPARRRGAEQPADPSRLPGRSRSPARRPHLCISTREQLRSRVRETEPSGATSVLRCPPALLRKLEKPLAPSLTRAPTTAGAGGGGRKGWGGVRGHGAWLKPAAGTAAGRPRAAGLYCRAAALAAAGLCHPGGSALSRRPYGGGLGGRGGDGGGEGGGGSGGDGGRGGGDIGLGGLGGCGGGAGAGILNTTRPAASVSVSTPMLRLMV
jgi:hypothetical protein